MLKKTKRFASLFVALAMIMATFAISPISFNGSAKKVLADDPEAPTDTACLMFADGDWSHGYWGDDISWNDPDYPDENYVQPIPDGVTPTNATVTGTGKYTVKLEFETYTPEPEEPEEGEGEGGDGEPAEPETKDAVGINFMAIGIKTGEFTFPSYSIKLMEIRVNGRAIDITGNPYTNSDTQGADTPYEG
ncbi:MAG TPA: hypothetical protein GX745_03005 [Clostridiales bacterium]|nr:hypothetical protein [Clostridiales bacterium]